MTQQHRSDEKAALRQRFLARRRTLSDASVRAAREAVAAHVLRRAAEERWRIVAAYQPFRTEPGPPELLERLADLDARVLLPVVLPDKDLDWTFRGGGQLLGLAAISACEALLVPALAVSRTGTRLGRGGGSYDRALARRRREAPAIAIVYDEEVVEDLPADPWDVPVTEAVTPGGFVVLRNT